MNEGTDAKDRITIIPCLECGQTSCSDRCPHKPWREPK